MSLLPDSRSKRKTPLVTDSSDLPSLDSLQQFGRRDLEGLSARERAENLLQDRRVALIEYNKTRKRLNDIRAKTRKYYETKRGMFQSANEMKEERERRERERREREDMEREERRTRNNINAETARENRERREREAMEREERIANALRLQEDPVRETDSVDENIKETFITSVSGSDPETDSVDENIKETFITSVSGSDPETERDEMLEGLYQERQRNAAIAARMARNNEILMTTDEWNRAKERSQEAFNERRRSAARERASTPSSSSAPVPKKIKKGYAYELIPVETPEIETSRSRRKRERDARTEDAEIEAAIKAVADQEAVEALFELSRRNRGGKRKTRRVRKSKKMKKRIKRRKTRK